MCEKMCVCVHMCACVRLRERERRNQFLIKYNKATQNKNRKDTIFFKIKNKIKRAIQP